MALQKVKLGGRKLHLRNNQDGRKGHRDDTSRGLGWLSAKNNLPSDPKKTKPWGWRILSKHWYRWEEWTPLRQMGVGTEVSCPVYHRVKKKGGTTKWQPVQ